MFVSYCSTPLLHAYLSNSLAKKLLMNFLIILIIRLETTAIEGVKGNVDSSPTDRIQ